MSLIHRPSFLDSGVVSAVFALLGDDVALPCSIPSVGSCSEVRWNVSGDFPGLYTEVARAGVVTPEQPPTVRVGPGCSLHSRRLERSSARTYVCGDGRSSARLSLEILQISAAQEGSNLTLSCLLTCALDRCDQDVTLGWTRGSQYAWLSGGSHSTKNTIISKIFTADVQLTGAPVVCSVYKDGVLRASKTWSATNNIMGLKRMLEKLGVAKTHLELKKILSEVSAGNLETICYRDFLHMMLGKKNAILKLILMFEGMGKDKEPVDPGRPSRKTFADLP
ncbi:unnamed protein product [Lota lota]